MLPGEERTLLLLGLLMAQSQHGYQINEFIERNLSAVIDMKKPTAYAVLDRLAAAGYVSVQTEQEGRRPPRNVYAITDAGTERFFELLREGLAKAASGPLAGDVPLMFLDHLPPDDVARCLSRRLAEVKGRLADRRQVPPHGFGRGVDLAVHHQIALLEAEAAWIQATLDGLLGG